MTSMVGMQGMLLSGSPLHLIHPRNYEFFLTIQLAAVQQETMQYHQYGVVPMMPEQMPTMPPALEVMTCPLMMPGPTPLSPSGVSSEVTPQSVANKLRER